MFLWLGLLLVEGILVLALPMASECDDGVAATFANQTEAPVAVFRGTRQILTLEPNQQLSVAFICGTTVEITAQTVEGQTPVMQRSFDCDVLHEMFKRKEVIIIQRPAEEVPGAANR